MSEEIKIEEARQTLKSYPTCPQYIESVRKKTTEQEKGWRREAAIYWYKCSHIVNSSK